jgi:hypothetical protein
VCSIVGSALERGPVCTQSHVTTPELPRCKQVSDGLGQQVEIECARSQVLCSSAIVLKRNCAQTLALRARCRALDLVYWAREQCA